VVGDARAMGGLRTGRRQTGWICTLTAGDVAGELCLTRDELRFVPSQVRARARSLSVSPRWLFLSLACVRAFSLARSVALSASTLQDRRRPGGAAGCLNLDQPRWRAAASAPPSRCL
jgi:hypothetical protein